MNIFVKSLASASLAIAAVSAAPATAQVQGNIATVNTPGVVIGTNAFQTAYQQVTTTYQSQIETRRQRNEQRQTLLRELDTNNDNQLDEAEQQAAANAPQLTQIQALDTEIQQITGQIDGARVYAIEQILAQFPAAMQEVVQAQNIQIVLTPEAFIYAPNQADISQQVVTSLNTRLPSVGIVPPQDWQPNRQSVALFQQIQQALIANAARQQAAAAQQQQQPQSTEAPSGR